MNDQINIALEDFKKFMRLNDFPDFEISYALTDSDSNSPNIEACANYAINSKQHTLILPIDFSVSKSTLFHEFTHIWDYETQVQGDKIRSIGLNGYSEFHASQVQLAHLLSFPTIDSISSFSMNKTICPHGESITVEQHINDKYDCAVSLFENNYFRKNAKCLLTSLGVLFNYWGFRSICEKHATDYQELINNSVFLDSIPTNLFSSMNRLMHGFLTEEEITQSIDIYNRIISHIIEHYRIPVTF